MEHTWRFLFDDQTEYDIIGKPTYFSGRSFHECYNKFLEGGWGAYEDNLIKIEKVVE